MDILPMMFRSCKFSGFWYDDSSNLLLKILYSGFVGFVIVHLLLSEIIELLTTRNSLKEASEMLFIAGNFTSSCIKVLNLVSRRIAMQNLLKDFRLPICQSKSLEEKEIINKHNNLSSKVCIGYCSLTMSTGVILSVAPLFDDELQLPYRGYQMFNISGLTSFTVACSLQFFGIFYAILIDSTIDAMVYGFLILATGQMEVNRHRIVNTTVPLKTCIEHQILMCGVVRKIQNLFILAVVPQFFFSLTTICNSIFIMSQMPVTDPEFLSFAMCFISMLSQLFFYCWFGNELKLKNQELIDAVYTSNWINCDKKERKNLCFVMLYAKRETTISFHGQSGLTLDTFIWVVKMSYATFNLLRKSAN